MSTKSEGDYATGVYRCKDSIKNFKIRIRLQQETSSFIPLPDLQENLSGGEAVAQAGIEGVEVEERTFSWQEKAFSMFEVSQYQNIANCHTVLEEKYHQAVKELCKDNTPNNRLFTFTSADDFTDMEEVNTNVTTDSKTVVTSLVKGFSELRVKQKFAMHRKSRSKQAQNLKRDIVDYSPSDETRKKNHLVDSFPQVMYILADLSIKEAESDAAWFGKSEYVLCVIRYDNNSRVLSITPDFSAGASVADSYRMEVDGDVRNAYRYWIEHASADIGGDDREREAEVANKLYAHRSEIRRQQVGSDFGSARGGTMAVVLLGEINAAKGFEYDHLFVRYTVHLPEGWSCEDPTSLKGVTHNSSTGRTGFAAFGHLFEISLTLSLNEMFTKEDQLPSWPRLLLQVISLDGWHRRRVEGYGWADIPAEAGSHRLLVNTWRPRPATHVGQMRRFFVGADDQLDDIAYVAVPTGFQGALLSKYGLRTNASGSLSLRLNVVHQSEASVAAGDQPASGIGGKQAAFLLERLSAASLVNSVNNVLTAFKNARDRMLAAREGLELKDS